MPDGDAVHNGPSAVFKDAYQELCDGYFDSAHSLQTVMRAFHRSVRRYGNAPINAICQLASSLNEISDIAALDMYEESLLIDQYAADQVGNKRGMSLEIEASKETLLKAINGQISSVTLQTFVYAYLMRIFESDFKECLPFGKQHRGADLAIVLERIDELMPEVRQHANALAARIAHLCNVNHLNYRDSRPQSATDFSSMDISMLE